MLYNMRPILTDLMMIECRGLLSCDNVMHAVSHSPFTCGRLTDKGNPNHHLVSFSSPSLFLPLNRSTDIIKVFDGNASMRKRIFRTIAISRSATKDQLIAASLRAFHIHDDPRYYILTDVYGKCLTGRRHKGREMEETGSRMVTAPFSFFPFLPEFSLFHGQKGTTEMIVSFFFPLFISGVPLCLFQQQKMLLFLVLA